MHNGPSGGGRDTGTGWDGYFLILKFTLDQDND